MRAIKKIFEPALYRVFGLLPLKNKVIASSFEGKRFDDNSKYIVEALHKLDPSVEIVWMKDGRYQYDVPDYIRTVDLNNKYKRVYEYATAKVWVDTHHLRGKVIRRKNQLYIQTWHGGISIKKVGHENGEFKKQNRRNTYTLRTVNTASVFISNSDHLDHVYHDEFDYHGPIYKCGYPRSDVLFTDNTEIKKKVCKNYGISENKKIMLYAPTFRDGMMTSESAEEYKKLYDIDFKRLCDELEKKFGGEWIIFIKLHPLLADSGISICEDDDCTIDATRYPEIQDILMSCDAFISDYSSFIFDAAMRKVPCFTYAKDLEEYKRDRGIEYDLIDLPFPYAADNHQLMQNIEKYDNDDYMEKWKKFEKRIGLCETGHAAIDVAKRIKAFIDGNPVKWE